MSHDEMIGTAQAQAETVEFTEDASGQDSRLLRMTLDWISSASLLAFCRRRKQEWVWIASKGID